MTTTDRMSNLDSRRIATDRVGQTVILGNSVSGAALSAIARIVAAAAGTSEVKVPFSMTAGFTMNLVNGSFGIWAVDWRVISAASLASSGAAIAAMPFRDITAGLLTWGADAMLLNIQVKTSTGVYTPTAGTAKVVVQALGGGGGGGGCASNGSGTGSVGGGGGSGASATGIITSGFSGVTVTVGAGGAGGVAGANNGSAGNSSSFGSVLIGGGGSGGNGGAASTAPGATAGGAGGSASGTASLFGASGVYGNDGLIISGLVHSGYGGSTIYGGVRGVTASINSVANGLDGTGFGCGGSGASAVGVSSGGAGGAGASGLVIIYEYNA